MSTFLFPATAEAHSDLRLGPFGAGILHPIETLPHLLVLIALGLLLGRRPPFRLWPLFVVFAPTTALVMLSEAFFHSRELQPLLTPAVFAIGLGALLASGYATPLVIDLALLAFAGGSLGLDSGFTNPSALIVAKVLFGNWVAFLVIIGYVAFYSSLLPPNPSTQRAFRIAGSWIVAIGLLALILSLRAVP